MSDSDARVPPPISPSLKAKAPTQLAIAEDENNSNFATPMGTTDLTLPPKATVDTAKDHNETVIQSGDEETESPTILETSATITMDETAMVGVSLLLEKLQELHATGSKAPTQENIAAYADAAGNLWQALTKSHTVPSEYKDIAEVSTTILERTVIMVRELFGVAQSFASDHISRGELAPKLEAMRALFNETKTLLTGSAGLSLASPTQTAASPLSNSGTVSMSASGTATPGVSGSFALHAQSGSMNVSQSVNRRWSGVDNLMNKSSASTGVADLDVLGTSGQSALGNHSGLSPAEDREAEAELEIKETILYFKTAHQQAQEEVEELTKELNYATNQLAKIRAETSEKIATLLDNQAELERHVVAYSKEYTPPREVKQLRVQLQEQQEQIRELKHCFARSVTPDGAQSGGMMSPGGVAAISGGSTRYNRLDTLYADRYAPNRGLDLVWAAVNLCYRREYEKTAVYDDSPGNSPGKHQVTAQAAAPVTTPQRSEPDPFESFKQDFTRIVVDALNDRDEFESKLSSIAPLRSLYIAECVKTRVKPNSEILRIIGLPHAETRVTELDLSNNYIGDLGLIALLPILPRLLGLKCLRLADNGLRHRGVHVLVKELMNHPSLANIDLSHNRLSRSAGKDVLQLVSASTRIHRVNLEQTNIDQLLVDRIEERIERNAAANGVTAAPAE